MSMKRPLEGTNILRELFQLQNYLNFLNFRTVSILEVFQNQNFLNFRTVSIVEIFQNQNFVTSEFLISSNFIFKIFLILESCNFEQTIRFNEICKFSDKSSLINI